MARREAIRVEVLTLSKPALMSQKSLKTLTLGLSRVLIMLVRGEQASKELRPGKEPHWFEWRRLLE